MKQFLFFTMAFVLVFPSISFAGRMRVEKIIPSTTLSASPTLISGDKKVKSAEKLAFFVTYDETQVGNAISVAVTVLVSPDDVTYQAASFYDYAGGSTLQTSETISADGNYYFWFNRDLAVPYVRVTITATNTDADDIAVVTATLIAQE